MREIKFRGKRIDTGEWVYGYYAYHKDYGKGRDTHRIYEVYAESDPEVFFTNYHEVDPDTVGQYTGLKDKKGKEIYEGDIISFIDKGELDIVEVKYNGAAFDPICFLYWGIFIDDSEVKVIGNIHDNPELLEDGK